MPMGSSAFFAASWQSEHDTPRARCALWAKRGSAGSSFVAARQPARSDSAASPAIHRRRGRRSEVKAHLPADDVVALLLVGLVLVARAQPDPLLRPKLEPPVSGPGVLALDQEERLVAIARVARAPAH